MRCVGDAAEEASPGSASGSERLRCAEKGSIMAL